MPGRDDNPFAVLQSLRDQLPAGPVAKESPQSPDPAVGVEGPARAVVRIERKGRGGKEATVIEKLDLPPAELAAWLKELKSALGCGGAVEDEALVLQGDQRERVLELLRERGVRKVIRG